MRCLSCGKIVNFAIYKQFLEYGYDSHEIAQMMEQKYCCIRMLITYINAHK